VSGVIKDLNCTPVKTLALWICLAAVATGQAVPELEALRRPFLKSLDALATERMERLQQLQAGYLRGVEEVRRKLASQGDLPGVLAARAEAARAAEWVVPTAEQERALPAPLAQLRRQYALAMDRVLVELEPREAALRAAYMRDLEELQRRLTQADRLAAALVVKAEREWLEPPVVALPMPALRSAERRGGTPKSLVLASGVKVEEGRDLETVVSVDRGKTYAPAVVVRMPNTHAVLEGTQYVKPFFLPLMRDFHYLQFKRTFQLPAGFEDARLEIAVYADDAAEVFLNGRKFGGQSLKEAAMNSQSPPSRFQISSADGWSDDSPQFRVGENVLEIAVTDYRPPTGVDFKATVTYQE
jgi:hypothetical protein